MKIGILKETKTPIDNRVALSPAQIKSLQDKYPDAAFVVEPSDIRVFADDEYRECGIEVNSDMSDCDVLFQGSQNRDPHPIEALFLLRTYRKKTALQQAAAPGVHAKRHYVQRL